MTVELQTPSPPVVGGDRIPELLVKTSRTFALSIPMLPVPTRRQVGIAYLLFRIADTFEDAERWGAARQLTALDRFVRLLDDDDPAAERQAAAGWLEPPPCDHAGYLELLAETPAVLAELRRLDPEALRPIVRHTRRTARGMAGFVARKGSADGRLQLVDVADLQGYCYVVAGIVGELLTELFVLGAPSLAAVADRLEADAARFGEGLQLVNILKDSAGDAEHGRSYLPPRVARGEIFALARHDLDGAGRYCRTMQEHGAPRGMVAFCSLPVRLARASLDRVQEAGPGAKLTRPEVFGLRAALEADLDAGAPAVPVG